MKFVVISDTHGLHRDLELPDGDAIIHAGDFCGHDDENDAIDFLEWLTEQDFSHKIFIGGNHDFIAANDPDKFEDWIPEGITYLNDSGVEIEGINIWGSPVQPGLEGWAFGKRRDEGMNRHWDLIPWDVHILVTHTPPYGILDQASSGKSVGCEELSKKLFFLNPIVHVFGHVHASYGIEEDDRITFINGSNIETDGGIVNAPITFDLDLD